MKRKLLFFDIDGTLLPEVDGAIPESTIHAIEEAQKLGHYTFINTGRTAAIIPEQLTALNFDGYLCGCGTHLILRDEVFLDKEFDQARGKELALHARNHQIPILLEGNKACYFDSHGLTEGYLEETTQQIFNSFPDKILDINEHPDFVFSKFCTICKTKEELHTLLEPFSDYFEPIDRGDFLYEIVPIGFSKASAIDSILEKLGQSLDDCYVFGDSTNDLSMLTHVPHSIGMGNSHPDVLKAVSYITTPVWRDGIAVAMKHFGLI